MYFCGNFFLSYLKEYEIKNKNFNLQDLNILKEIIDFLKLRFYLIMTNKFFSSFFNMFDNRLSESTQ